MTDIWRIYYEHWSKSVQPIKKSIFLNRCANRIKTALEYVYCDFFEDILIYTLHDDEEKRDVFHEIYINDPKERFQELQELADHLFYNRVIKPYGQLRFQYLYTLFHEDPDISDLLDGNFYSLWGIHERTMMFSPLCKSDQYFLDRIRNTDSIICIY